MEFVILGFLAAFMGFLPPGMLNLITVKVSIASDRWRAFLFSLGAATTIGIQGMIATLVLHMLDYGSPIVETLKSFAIVVLMSLAYYFYRLSFKKQGEGKNLIFKSTFLSGLVMATFNLIAVPFFVGILIARGASITSSATVLFGLGTASGSLALFSVYNLSSAYVLKRIGVVTRNINMILATLFVVLALILLIQKLKGF